MSVVGVKVQPGPGEGVSGREEGRKGGGLTWATVECNLVMLVVVYAF